MTDSSTAPTSAQKTKQLPPKQPSNAAYAFLVLVFRVLLLGIGGSFAGLAGIAVANFYPAQMQEPPLFEKLLRRTGELVNWLERSPNQEPEPVVPSSIPSTSPLPSVAPARSLSETERQQLQTELSQIRQDLEALGDRTASLEGRLGSRLDQASLEARLQEIERQLNPQTATTGAPATSSGQSVPTVEMLSTSTTQPGTLVITLPSDALFGTQSNLQAGAEAILNSIVADLRTYPGASIRVAAYTDPQTDAAGDRTRSFAQAQAVKQYLSGVLGNDNFHWVAIGYGNRNPIAANDSPANRQRNRRVEITIDPP